MLKSIIYHIISLSIIIQFIKRKKNLYQYKMIKYNQLRLIIFCRNETSYCKIHW